MTPTKRTAKKAAPEPPKERPLIRIAMNDEDMARLLDRLGEWDDPLLHRLRMRYTKHRIQHPS